MILPKAKKMFGPPVAFHGESKRFIESHIHANDLLGGPGIEGNRWWIEVSRDHSDALSYLKYIIEGNESIGIPRSIERLAKESGRVLFNKEIKPYLNNGFSKFLLMFLNGRPAWLDE
jgi:hypothetical protein